MTLKDKVRVHRRFQRSIRIDTDLNDPLALEGFICPPTFAQALLTLAEQVEKSGQGAFTWTGPFGGGKSSLAVVLAALVSSSGNLRKLAMSTIGGVANDIVSSLNPGRSGYRSLAVVGRKSDCAQLIADALKRDGLIRQPIDVEKDNGEALLKTILKIANDSKKANGLVIFIDEMGKILEGAAQGKLDLHFLQELAEIASRSNRRLIVVGILHQAFGEYTGRLSRQIRNEWMKVQGRFVDIPLATVTEEQLALLSHAIDAPKPPKSAMLAATTLAKIIADNRSAIDPKTKEYLAGCWPLNPVTASLLGPYSRRRFGQNQRSIFSFLNSSEPHGFQNFLSHGQGDEAYLPCKLWDYLRSNLEPSILASPDSHKWSTAIDAFERCELRGGTSNHLMVAKTIAVIEQFREQTGVFPSEEVLSVATPALSARTRGGILKDLEGWSIVAYRRHLGAWSMHAGSDFEIETAIDQERDKATTLDYSRIRELSSLKPIVAKRHYHRTGAMHWIDIDIAPVNEIDACVKKHRPTDGSLGLFIIALPSPQISQVESEYLLKKASKPSRSIATAGMAPNGEMLLDLAHELDALGRIRTERAELSGDAIARREVEARLDTTRQALESALLDAFLSMSWHSKGKVFELGGLAAIHRYASDLAQLTYPKAPRLCNELLNRSKPSSTAVAARRVLMHAMVTHRGKERLGIVGYPAESGLFTSLLSNPGLYGIGNIGENVIAFSGPPEIDKCNLRPLWDCADKMLADSINEPISLETILVQWRSAPFGVRNGLLPVLALAYMLSRVDRLAIYLDGVFRPALDTWLVDRMHQESNAIHLRKMDFGKLRSSVLRGIQGVVSEYDTESTEQDDPLVIARRLVGIVTGLPKWTQRTTTISQDAQRLRRIVTTASDPHRFLFDDLPGFASSENSKLTTDDITSIVSSIREGLVELVDAYPNLLSGVEKLVFTEIGIKNTKAGFDDLAKRAQAILGVSGNYRLDAFATRLADFGGSIGDIEGILSLASSKPPRDWVDRDLDNARLEIAELAQQFNRCEAFARVKGRTDHRHAIAFVLGMPGSPKTLMEEFEIDKYDTQNVNGLAEKIRDLIDEKPESRQIILAALAQIGAEVLASNQQNSTSKRKIGRRVAS